MSVERLTLVICDDCGETYGAGDSKMVTAMEQRKGYPADGWVYRAPYDYCSECK